MLPHIVAFGIAAATMVISPKAMARPTSIPLPPPGFGEPLNPGPYVFFPDHRNDWVETADGVQGIVRLLPDSAWQLCYVPAFDRSARRHDRVRAQRQLQMMLVKTGMRRLRIVDTKTCAVKPRELDAFHLVIKSGIDG